MGRRRQVLPRRARPPAGRHPPQRASRADPRQPHLDHARPARANRSPHRRAGAPRRGPPSRLSEVSMRKSTAAAGSAIFFAIAPGVVAGLVPWWLTGWRVRGPLTHWATVRVTGLVMLVAGAIVLIDAFARFVAEGHGTPAPAAPAGHLVIARPSRDAAAQPGVPPHGSGRVFPAPVTKPNRAASPAGQ